MCSWNVASVTVMLQVLWRCYKYGRGVQKNNCYVTSVMQCYKYQLRCCKCNLGYHKCYGSVTSEAISQILM